MNTEFKGTVGIYVRVSTVEQAQEGYSIAAQKERLKAYCDAQGWDDYKFYVDEGTSAKDLKRPQLTQLFEHIKEGKINLILVYRLDRFTRSVRDLHKMLEVMDKHNCGFRSATEVYDTTSAMGRLFITIVAALAEWESANSSERIKMMLEKKVSDGDWVGPAPYGFDLSEDEKLVKNKKSEVILDMIQMYMSGRSINSIADHLTITNDDKSTWYANSIFRLLKNPAIYGATRWVDKIYENTHEGIITKEKFNDIQEIMKERAMHVRRDIGNDYLFQGILVCPSCGNRLSVNRYSKPRADGTPFKSAIYRCGKCQKSKKFLNTPGERSVLKALYDYMKVVKVNQSEVKVEKDVKWNNIKRDLSKIERKREKYQKGWASDLISDIEFGRLMEETRGVYDDLKSKVEAYEPVKIIGAEELEELILAFNEGFEQLTTDEKKAFVSQFIKEIHIESKPQPPKEPHKHKEGRPLLVITNVVFR